MVYNVIKHGMAVMVALTPLTTVRSIRIHRGTTMVASMWPAKGGAEAEAHSNTDGIIIHSKANWGCL